jgi:hypothetical protein
MTATPSATCTDSIAPPYRGAEMRSLSRDAIVALTVSALLIIAMAIDHLVGTDSDPDEESGLADPGAFVLSVALSLALTALLFAVVVPKARDDPADAAVRGIACSALAIPAIVLAFLGLPYPLAAAGNRSRPPRTRGQPPSTRLSGSRDRRTRGDGDHRRLCRGTPRVTSRSQVPGD